MPPGEVRDVRLIPDQFSSAHDALPVYPNEPELPEAVRDAGVDNVCGAIEAEFVADPGWNGYPRFQQINDITALRIVVDDGRAVGGTGTP